MFKSFRYAFLIPAVLAVPVLTNGCSQVAAVQSAVCCTEYQPGADMLKADFKVDASIKGEFTAFAQASGDIATVGGQAVNDVTSSCMTIATDLGASPVDPGADGLTGRDLMNFWCAKATSAIGATFTATGVAKGQLKLEYQPPQCSMSLQAQADCQGTCDVSGKCDIKATPPKCTGGTLEIDCRGGCTGEVSAPNIECTGSCSGSCTGSCEAQGGVSVDCVGQCEGTCAAGGSTGGSGVQGDGSCKGTCTGKCNISAQAPKLTCKGTCSGHCDAKCSATPGQLSVQCSGKCDAEYQPLECKGGKLEGGCQVQAQCQASCNASVQAKAKCTEPKLALVFSGSVKVGTEGQFNILRNSLQANLPKLLVVLEARGKNLSDSVSGLVQVGGDLVASGKLDAHALGCANLIGVSVQGGIDNFGAAYTASGSVLGTVQ